MSTYLLSKLPATLPVSMLDEPEVVKPTPVAVAVLTSHLIAGRENDNLIITKSMKKTMTTVDNYKVNKKENDDKCIRYMISMIR